MVTNEARERIAEVIFSKLRLDRNPRVSALRREMRDAVTDALVDALNQSGMDAPRFGISSHVEHHLHKSLDTSLRYAVRVALLSLLPDKG